MIWGYHYFWKHPYDLNITCTGKKNSIKTRRRAKHERYQYFLHSRKHQKTIAYSAQARHTILHSCGPWCSTYVYVGSEWYIIMAQIFTNVSQSTAASSCNNTWKEMMVVHMQGAVLTHTHTHNLHWLNAPCRGKSAWNKQLNSTQASAGLQYPTNIKESPIPISLQSSSPKLVNQSLWR